VNQSRNRPQPNSLLTIIQTALLSAPWQNEEQAKSRSKEVTRMTFQPQQQPNDRLTLSMLFHGNAQRRVCAEHAPNRHALNQWPTASTRT